MLLKGYLGFNTQHKFRFYVKPFLKKQSFNCLLPSYIVIECISCCCCSAAKSCLMLCNPMNYSMPGFPVLHYLPELAQTQCPLSRWCHPTITFSVSPFSSCLQSFSGLKSFPMIWLFASGGQSIGASTSASVLPMSIQGWFPLGLIGLIFFLSKELSRVFFSTTIQKYKFFSAQPSLWFNSHILKWLLEKP